MNLISADAITAHNEPLLRHVRNDYEHLGEQLARRGIGYDPGAKRAFHREARSALRVAVVRARGLNLPALKNEYETKSASAQAAMVAITSVGPN